MKNIKACDLKKEYNIIDLRTKGAYMKGHIYNAKNIDMNNLTDIDAKKYFSALMIGKLPMVYFWGFIGKSLLESITDPYTIAQVVFMVLSAYLVSRLANKFIK